MELIFCFGIGLQLNFDTATSERLSGFLQATLQTLAVILEVSAFQDIAKHSEELLNYLRLVIVHEPGPCLHGVQQVRPSPLNTALLDSVALQMGFLPFLCSY